MTVTICIKRTSILHHGQFNWIWYPRIFCKGKYPSSLTTFAYLPPSDVGYTLLRLSSSSSEQLILRTRTTGSGFCFMVLVLLPWKIRSSNRMSRIVIKRITTDRVLLFVLFIHQDKQTYSDWCLISQKDNNEISWYASPAALSSR